MTKQPFITHSEITNEIYIVCETEKYIVTEQVIKAMKKTGRLEQCESEEAKFPVVTLIGSTKFKQEFEKLSKELTFIGFIVLNLSIFSGYDDDVKIDTVQKEMLIKMTHQKIDMADLIYIVNPDGYIGEDTANEIEYAMSKGKTIKYLFNQKGGCSFDT